MCGDVYSQSSTLPSDRIEGIFTIFMYGTNGTFLERKRLGVGQSSPCDTEHTQEYLMTVQGQPCSL